MDSWILTLFNWLYSITVIIAKAETPLLWPLDATSQLIGKDPDAWKDWGQVEKGATEDEVVGQHHQLSGHKFEQTPAARKDREACCAAVHGVAKSQTWLSNWAITTVITNFGGQITSDLASNSPFKLTPLFPTILFFSIFLFWGDSKIFQVTFPALILVLSPRNPDSFKIVKAI